MTTGPTATELHQRTLREEEPHTREPETLSTRVSAPHDDGGPSSSPNACQHVWAIEDLYSTLLYCMYCGKTRQLQ